MKTSIYFRALMLTALITIFLHTAIITAKGVEKRITFQKGSSSAVLEGSIVRGDQDTYLIGARAKQTMYIYIGSLEDNGVFTIIDRTTGKALKGAEEGTDTKRWVGSLPSTGDYKIVVSATRGNAQYIMKVEIE